MFKLIAVGDQKIKLNFNADSVPIYTKPFSEQDKIQQEIIQSYQKISYKKSPLIVYPPKARRSIRGEIAYDHIDPIVHQNEVIPNLFIGDFSSFKAAVKENPYKIDLAIRVNHQLFDFKPLTNIKIMELGFDVPDDNSEQSWNNLSAKFGVMFLAIDNALAQNKHVLISCTMGRSRSSTVVMAYLMYRYHVTFKQAFSFLFQKRLINPRDNFVAGLKAYEKRLKDYLLFGIRFFRSTPN
ncbi:MAG: dual specificity protein phosphatase [Candidatus Margulisiibacteriota bacterium]|jgi:protein-tyrosine phosphatase